MATIKVLWETVTGHLTQQWGAIPGVTGWMTKQGCEDLNPTEPSVFLFLCLSKTIDFINFTSLFATWNPGSPELLWNHVGKD